MAFSEFLESRRHNAKELVNQLHRQFDYVSVLGVDTKAKTVRVDKNSSVISATAGTECGFVVKLSNGGVFFEYSMDDISGDMAQLAANIADAFHLSEALQSNSIDGIRLPDDPLVRSFAREHDLNLYSDAQLLDYCKNLHSQLTAKSEHILNAVISLGSREVSTLFLSVNRELDQNYAWINGNIMAVYRENGKVVQTREGAGERRHFQSTHPLLPTDPNRV